jgi:hypothetical protein
MEKESQRLQLAKAKEQSNPGRFITALLGVRSEEVEFFNETD